MTLIAINLNRYEEQELFQAISDHLLRLENSTGNVPRRIKSARSVLQKVRNSRMANN